MELLVGMMTRHEHLLAREKELNKEIEHLTLTLLEAIDFEEDYDWIKNTANRLEQALLYMDKNMKNVLNRMNKYRFRGIFNGK